MTKLTQKQEQFCVSYIKNGRGTDAYREAYSVEKMSPLAVKSEAGKLMAMPKIRERIAELRAPMVKAAKITLESHLRALERLRDKADKEQDYGAAIRAEVARGKASGLYVEKIDLNFTGSLAERLARARSRT